MKGKKSTIIGKANRYIVFRCLKKYMAQHLECPTPMQVSEETGLHRATVTYHMQGLRGAAGLPVPIPSHWSNATRKRWEDGAYEGRYEPKDLVSLIGDSGQLSQ
jgi:hypothetical protein